MSSKPTVLPLWSTDASNESPPSSGQRASGWNTNQIPPSSVENYDRHKIGDWLQYVSDGYLDGAFGLVGTISPTALGTSQNNWSPTGLSGAVVVRIALTASVDISGIAGGAAGRLLVLVNLSDGSGTNPYQIRLIDEDSFSTAENRFTLPQNQYGVTHAVILAEGETATFWYDGTSSRWRLLATTAANEVAAIPIPASAGQTSRSGSDYWEGGVGDWTNPSAANVMVGFPIILPYGTIIQHVAVYATDTAGGHKLRAKLWKQNLLTGVSSQIGSNVDSAGDGSDQQLVLSGNEIMSDDAASYGYYATVQPLDTTVTTHSVRGCVALVSRRHLKR